MSKDKMAKWSLFVNQQESYWEAIEEHEGNDHAMIDLVPKKDMTLTDGINGFDYKAGVMYGDFTLDFVLDALRFNQMQRDDVLIVGMSVDGEEL